MRTNIDIDDKLMRQAMKATGATTKKAAVEASLRQMVQLKKQAEMKKSFGNVVWRGPEDDWFASDEEIREKRRRAERDSEPSSQDLPAPGQQPATDGELR